MVSGHCKNGGVREESGACSGSDCADFFCSIENMAFSLWHESESDANGCFSFENGGGHCSQVVWVDSEFIGCGLGSCGSGRSAASHLVCNYNPPGNFPTEP